MIKRKKNRIASSNLKGKTTRGRKTVRKNGAYKTIKKVTRRGKEIKGKVLRRTTRGSYNKAYDTGFDETYNEGFNVGYAEGINAGHQEA